MHDIDRYPNRALAIANIEVEMGLLATYYFRMATKSYDENIIQQIVSLGHKAGYHYESLTTCNGDVDAAYEDFCRNLEKLRKVVPVSTACAHGSPKSRWDSQALFSATHSGAAYYDIHSLGIDYEPMLDTDFSTTLYLTDTGRRWDGYRVSVRDKVSQCQERWIKEGLVFHSTDDIIHAINDISHPIHRYSLLVNTHPQRWMPFGMAWFKEAVLQNAKNIIKGIVVKKRNQN